MSQECWRSVVGYGGVYSVSNWGRIRSEDRIVRRVSGLWRLRGKILSSTLNNDGYATVVLCHEGKRKHSKVSPLVLSSFIGPRPEGQNACHNNGIRNDDRLENLRWDTRWNNQLDKVVHGSAKLSPEVVRTIRSSKGTLCQIAQIYGVAHSTISRIKRRTLWGYVP